MDSRFDQRVENIYYEGQKRLRQRESSGKPLRGRVVSLQSVHGRGGQSGATLVEFALVIMVFMMMILGIIDFSRALYTYHFLDNAARTATRWAAVNGYTCADDGSCPYGPTGTTTFQAYITACGGLTNGCGAQGSDISAYVTSLVPSGIDATKVSTTVTWPQQSDSPPVCGKTATVTTPPSPFTQFVPNYPGCTVQVQVSYPFNFIYPFIDSAAIQMSSTSEMVIAH